MPRKKYDRVCEGCGKPFKGGKDQRFCGRPCQSRYAGSHPKHSEKYREAALRRWNDPEKRAAWLAVSITPEANRKRSESSMGRVVSKETRELLSIANTGRIRTQETKDRISKACKKAWEDPERRQRKSQERIEYCQTDKGKAQMRKTGLLGIISQKDSDGPNKLEQAMHDALDTLGIEYIPEHPMFGHFLVDAYLPELNIAIETNGTYWHADPEVYGPGKQQMDQRQQLRHAQDAAKAKCLKKHGIQLIVLWERDKELFLEILKGKLNV
jgi:hypothetical protein